MTVYEIIRQKEQQVEKLTREIGALRLAARMLEEECGAKLAGSLVPNEVVADKASQIEQKPLRQFP